MPLWSNHCGLINRFCGLIKTGVVYSISPLTHSNLSSMRWIWCHHSTFTIVVSEYGFWIRSPEQSSSQKEWRGLNCKLWSGGIVNKHQMEVKFESIESCRIISFVYWGICAILLQFDKWKGVLHQFYPNHAKQTETLKRDGMKWLQKLKSLLYKSS